MPRGWYNKPVAKKRARTKRLSRTLLIEAARVFGRQGGKARLSTMTAEERREVAKKAAETRWVREKAKKAGGAVKTIGDARAE